MKIKYFEYNAGMGVDIPTLFFPDDEQKYAGKVAGRLVYWPAKNDPNKNFILHHDDGEESRLWFSFVVCHALSWLGFRPK